MGDKDRIVRGREMDELEERVGQIELVNGLATNAANTASKAKFLSGGMVRIAPEDDKDGPDDPKMPRVPDPAGMIYVSNSFGSMKGDWVDAPSYEAMKDRAEKAEAGLARVKMDRDSLQKCVDSLTLLLRPWL